MTKPQMSLMDVTRELTQRARAAYFKFGDDTAVVAIQHMLWQTIDLFEAITALGVRRENVFALGKVYSNSPVVIATLRNRGITVVENSPPKPGEFDHAFEQDVNRLWETARRALAQRRIRQLLILDDGGKCATSMPPDLLARYAVAGVEQTSFGIFVFEETPPPFTVLSWARSAVKLQIGGPLFSHCLLAKLQSHHLAGRPLTGEKIGIIGLGSIGSALATLMQRQENKVLFYDPDPRHQVSPYLRDRITRVDSLEDLLLRCAYVFGCSGRQPFKKHWPLRYRPGIKLFSASGGDHEFGSIINDLKTRPGFQVAPTTLDIQCDNGPSGPILIAYLGYPYNFVARDVEAVPTSIVQIETGGLLAGLLQAQTHLRLCEDGRATNRGIQRVSPALQRFVLAAWLKAMQRQQIDLPEVYGYDPALLELSRDRLWFVRNSEPRPSETYDPNWMAEAAMTRIVEEQKRSPLGGQRKLEPNLRSP
jgi:D-isomer specific 2-hydroxyacid dehydrogenase, NAD binding domain